MFRDLQNSKKITEEDESFILIHSLRDANMPKFLAEDVPLFESILDDLFPGVIPPAKDNGTLEVKKISNFKMEKQSLVCIWNIINFLLIIFTFFIVNYLVNTNILNLLLQYHYDI